MGTQTYPKSRRDAKHLQTGVQEVGSFITRTDSLTKKDAVMEVGRNVYGKGTGKAPSGSSAPVGGLPSRPNVISAS